ncbi:lipid II flippase MurJ [Aureibaculum sp. 2210JD6-5]|uniref:lipid II flippase MurJ n=1 Tax=Aureibaculum sp. 2210JD6-5 TaxID=3103957 RepID=UPI002AAE9F60|nr:lipid II flippase MurJ [Aureibaculum sp. 2210JD6-5]MDY7394203.1 lipid II flippase MurJ [Aureibaculum sp. 2210JD6-5]
MKILLKLFSLKLVSSLLGLLYSIIQVHYFGASRTIEIYFAAQSLVYLVTSLTQSGQLAEVFLPEYHKLNTIKAGLGYKGLNVVINRMVLFGTLLIVLIFAFAHYVVDLMVPGFSQQDKDFATLIFRILLPVLYLALMNSFYITVLNAEERFGRTELLGLTNTIVNILVLVVLYPFIELWALVISFILGKIIEFIFYVWQLYKNGYRFQRVLSIEEFDHISFFKTMQSTFLYVGATQIYSIVLTASISFLPEGVYAIFKYVQNLANKIKGLFIQPFMTIFFTKYSILLQKAKSVYKEFNKNIISIINVNAIVIIGTILLGDFIIDLIWGGEKFSIENVQLAYVFLLFNVVAVLLSSLGIIYRKMAVAHGKAKKLYLFWVIAQLLSAFFSFLLIKYFGIQGLLFIIPLNTFLMGLTSYLVYKLTDNSIDFKFYSRNNAIAIVLIGVAIFIKYLFKDTIFLENNILLILFFLLSVILLSLYPIFSTYKVLK